MRREAQWIGHVARMGAHRWPRAALFGTATGREQKQGRGTKKRFPLQVAKVIQHMPGVDERTWAQQAQNRAFWKESVRKIDAATRTSNLTDAVTCPICQQKAEDAKGLQRHINLKHPISQVKEYKCPTCGKGYKRKWARDEHERKVHGNGGAGEIEEKPKAHACRYCKKGFALKGTCGHHEKHDCLARPGSGAVLFQSKWVLVCRQCSSRVSLARRSFESTRSLALHRRQKHCSDVPP